MKKIFLIALLSMTFCLNASAMTGDVNNDGEVNISDVNAIIDLVLKGEYDASGDVNKDAEVNVSDINALLDIILSGGPVIDELVPKEIELDYSALTEPAERVPTDEDAAPLRVPQLAGHAVVTDLLRVQVAAAVSAADARGAVFVEDTGLHASLSFS